MRKLLQLNVTANWGSTGKIVEGIGAAAIKRGWQSTIIFGRKHNVSESNIIKIGNKIDLYSHYFRSRFFDGEGLGSKNSTYQLIAEIENYAPDLIQLHNIHDHWLNYPLLFRWLSSKNIPLVWTMHDCWPFTGGCFHFVNDNCSKWKTKCFDCPQRKNRIDSTKRNHELRQELFGNLNESMTIVSVSQWLNNQIANSIFKNNRHLTIYNGVNTDLFRPMSVESVNSLYNLDGKIALLGVSNIWSESKGLQYYIDLRKRLSDNYIIILVGLSKRQIKKLPNGIIGLERTNNIEELVALYSRSNIVLSLSQGETFGLTLAEGMSCGTPAIGFNTTAISEIISKDTGIVVPYGNVEAIRDAVHVLSNNPLSSDNCRNRVLQHFNDKSQYDKYVDLYEDILEKFNQ